MSNSNFNSSYSSINVLPKSEVSRISVNANDSTGYKSLISFLANIDKFGIQVQNNFEVEFSGIEGLTFFVQTFELPGSKQNTCEIFYDGIKITIPVNYEHEHEFSMTIINDMQGYIYSAIKSYIELDSYNHFTKPKTTLKIKVLTGQVRNSKIINKEKKETNLYGSNGSEIKYQGSVIMAFGVRLVSISGLSYGQNNNNIQTFTVQGTFIEYSHLPLHLHKTTIHN